MQLAEWTYFHVKEVWSAFNLLAEAVARGFRAHAPTRKLQEDLDAWNDAVHMPDKVRMWVKNALIYGRCVMWQVTDAGRAPIPAERVRGVFLRDPAS